jgi:hypothetical protein
VGAAAFIAKFFDEKIQQHVLDFWFERRGGVAIEVYPVPKDLSTIKYLAKRMISSSLKFTLN